MVFGADHGDRLERLRAYREIDARRARGGSLAVQAAWQWTKSAGPAESVCALARNALAGGELIRKDSLMAMAAAVVLALADLDEAVDVWDAMRAHAYRNGSAFTIGSVQLWGGYTQYRAAISERPSPSLRASLETVAFWGMTQAQWQSPILAEILVERGELGEARALLDAVISPPPSSDMQSSSTALRCGCCWPTGGRKRRSHTPTSMSSMQVEASPTLCAVAVAQGAGARATRPHDEAVALAGEELEIARGWGSPGTVGRSSACSAPSCARTGSNSSRRRARVEEVRRGSSRRRRLPGSAALRRARKPTEAREPLRRALELADVCGAQPLAEGSGPRSTRQAPARARPPSEECLP